MNEVTFLGKDLVRITTNEQLVPKKRQRICAEPILNNFRQLMEKVAIANHLRTDISYDLQRRIRIQSEVIETVVALTQDINFCIEVCQQSQNAFQQPLLKMKLIQNLAKKWQEHSVKCLLAIKKDPMVSTEFDTSSLAKKQNGTIYKYASSVRSKDIPLLTQSSIGE